MSEAEAVEVVVEVDAEQVAQKAFSMAMKAARIAGGNPVKSVVGYMPTDAFIALRGFGLNRDVSKRLKAEKNTHLKGSLTSEQQKKVAVVITSDSNGADFYNPAALCMKIDGHSRCAAWVEGKLEKPNAVEVTFFFNLSDSEILSEYDIFTNSKAQATQAEKNDIVNKVNHYQPKSEFCKSSWKNAFSVIGVGYEEGLKEFRDCLNVVDNWNITTEKGKTSTRRHVSGIKAALLETFDKDDLESWESFWKDFFSAESEIKLANDLRKFVKANTGNGSTVDKTVRKEGVKLFNKFNKAK